MDGTAQEESSSSIDEEGSLIVGDGVGLATQLTVVDVVRVLNNSESSYEQESEKDKLHV